MLRLPSYLHKHPASGIYYFRIAIPKALIPQIKQREWKKSLRTRDPNQAKRTARLLSLQADDLFRQLEGHMMPKKSNPELGLIFEAFTKHPDGKVEMKGVELDPDKPEDELKLLKGLIEATSATSPLPHSQVLLLRFWRMSSRNTAKMINNRVMSSSIRRL